MMSNFTWLTLIWRTALIHCLIWSGQWAMARSHIKWLTIKSFQLNDLDMVHTTNTMSYLIWSLSNGYIPWHIERLTINTFHLGDLQYTPVIHNVLFDLVSEPWVDLILNGWLSIAFTWPLTRCFGTLVMIIELLQYYIWFGYTHKILHVITLPLLTYCGWVMSNCVIGQLWIR